MSPNALSLAIAAEDSKSIARAQGVGAKTAAMIIIKLKDKFAKAFPLPAGTVEVTSPAGQSSAPRGSATKLSDARDALTVLGFSRAEATSVLRNVNTDQPLEDVIKEALAALMK